MKNQGLEYFKNLPKSKEEQFNKAFQLYKKCKEKSLSLERFYNQAGYSHTNLDALHYDLQKLLGITASQIKNFASAIKVVQLLPKIELTKDQVNETSSEDLINYFTQEKIQFPVKPNFETEDGYAEMKAYIKENNIESPSLKKVDILEAIDIEYHQFLKDIANNYFDGLNTQKNNQDDAPIKVTATSAEEVFTNAPEEVKEAIKLRDEFPFLNEKDCPDEFYILVGKMFNHLKAYKKAHENLLVVLSADANGEDVGVKLSEEEINALALSAVENFQVQEDIRTELQYFKENGKVLGNHPIFIERKLKESIDALTVEAGTKKISNLENYIRRDNKHLETAIKAKNTEDIEKFTQKVKEWEIELSLIKTKFNFSNDK